MKYIIMCGGQYTEWQSPRQMLTILGEPIVARTIRLLHEYGVDDVAISTNDERFTEFGVPLLHHNNQMVVDYEHVSGCWVDAFYPTDEPTCFIMGDVVFSPEAIQKIVNTDTDDILFFASTPPLSQLFIKLWAEPYAFKVADLKRFWAAVEFVRANAHTGIFRRSPIAWELWQVIQGKNVREIDYSTVTAINDYTCDVDHPDDAAAIEAIICKL